MKLMFDSLIGYSQLGLYDSHRMVEWQWSFKVMAIIRMLGRASWINNWTVLHRLAHFNLEFGRIKYYFDNSNAFHFISLYQAQHLNREVGIEGQLAEANKDS